MIIPAPNPVAFNLFGLPIYWYGVIMAVAIFVAIIIGNKYFNSLHQNIKKDFIINCSPIIIICGILGARLYFCMLNYSHYISHPLEILDIREGGLSIHGALLFGIIALILYCVKHKVSSLKVLDSLACATFLGQSMGRWGNYFNSEAYGFPVVGQKWGLFIPEGERITQYADFSLFHPTFLYESIFDLLGFGFLTVIYFKLCKKYTGLAFFVYMIIYSLIRYSIEQIRIDSALNIGSTPIAQIISIGMYILGCVGIIFVVAKNYYKSTD